MLSKEVVNSTNQYFRDIRDNPLLNHEQEIFNARKIESGRIAKTIFHLVYSGHPAVENALPLVGQDHSAGILQDSTCKVLERLGIQNDIEIVTKKELVTINKLDDYGKLVEEEKTIAEGLRVKDQSSLKTRLNPQTLEQIILEAEKSRHDFVVSNLRLVASVAKKYASRENDLLNLIQDGNIGLIKAVDHFEWWKGFKFSTYATWWIRQTIDRGIKDTGSPIRVPVHASEDLHRIEKGRNKLEQSLGRQPTMEELAEAIDMPDTQVNQIIKLTATAHNVVSIDAFLSIDGEETEDTLTNILKDERENPETQVVEHYTKMGIQAVVKDALTEREFRVLELRFGLEDGRGKTLQEVADEFGVTRERIRQIEVKALKKLGEPQNRAKMETFR